MKQQLTQSNILIENAHSMNQKPHNHPLSEQFTTPDPEHDSYAKDEVHNQGNRVQKQVKKSSKYGINGKVKVWQYPTIALVDNVGQHFT